MKDLFAFEIFEYFGIFVQVLKLDCEDSLMPTVFDWQRDNIHVRSVRLQCHT